jgi:hypothetical protein
LPTNPEEDISGLEFFYDQITLVLPLFGYDIFEQRQQKAASAQSNLEIFCKVKDASAACILLDDGKAKVLQGSKAKLENAPAFERHNYKKLKDELIHLGKLVTEGNQLSFTGTHS